MGDDVVDWFNDVSSRMDELKAPVLSICIPFFRFDIRPLLIELERQASSFAESIEILAVDDASGDPALIKELHERFAAASTVVRVSVFAKNLGRARIRNFLAAQARGEYVLFLDCDMYPDSDEFVKLYLEFARAGKEDVVVGGSSYLLIGAIAKEQYLYFYHSKRTQCVPVGVRRAAPLRFVFTNNMMIRTLLLRRITFDSGYTGWGYEDTDLAFAVARAGARIIHIDNSATHLGLIDDNALIAKYRNSAGNFAHLAGKFPAEVLSIPVFRAARMLSRLPAAGAELISKFCEKIARTPSLPVRLRYMALQCLKISLYSQILPPK
jgi:glycosyltransferase involved in cell wall biosynthesis